MRKIIGIYICVFFIATVLPITEAIYTEETYLLVDNTESHGYLLAHVVAKGTGNYFLMRAMFILGFGKCAVFVVDLEEYGNIKITSLLHPANSIELEGCHWVFILKFMEFQSSNSEREVNINGVVIFANWS